MTISFDKTTFNAGEVTAVAVTLSSDVRTAYIDTENPSVRLSTDGSAFSANISISESTTIYVRVASSATAGEDTIACELTDFNDFETVNISIVIEGGVEAEYESLSFGFSPRQATVQYTATLVNTPVVLGSKLKGTILDHHFSFEVERSGEQGGRKFVSGAAFAEWLVNSLIEYQVKFEFHTSTMSWERPTFTDHINAIKNAIGIDIVYRGADFYPSTQANYAYRVNPFHLSFYETYTGSFSEILNKLIGWSNDVPAMAINMYIENGTIYLVQRGYEQNTVTPAQWLGLPVLNRAIRHTQWANAQYVSIPKEISSNDAMSGGEPFSGTITWGTTSLTYDDGYLTTETRAGVTTTYTYENADEGKYLSRKMTVDTNENKCVVTTYSYGTTQHERYLHEETTSEYDGQDETGSLEKRTLTRYVPVQPGWYGVSVYDITDGTEQFVSDNLVSGPPGQKASQYMIQAGNDALKDSSSPRQTTVPLSSVAKARQSFPIYDLATLQAIANCLDDYEGSEEITLQGTIAGGTHIYTYDDVITYKGNQYKIVSNSVNRTGMTIRQSITAVRYVLH